jgi:ribosomal protein S18 acetylase RimI-like enzyme
MVDNGMMTFRLARADEESLLRELILTSFEPITWYKKLEAQVGPFNGLDWRARWQLRLDKIFATQIILVGEVEGQVVACATGSLDEAAKFGYVDLLAVAEGSQGKGYGREMLRGMLDHFRSLGMEQAHLECLIDNERGNALYASEGWEIVASHYHWFRKL